MTRRRFSRDWMREKGCRALAWYRPLKCSPHHFRPADRRFGGPWRHFLTATWLCVSSVAFALSGLSTPVRADDVTALLEPDERDLAAPDFWFDRYQHDAEDDGPDIREPGPDLGDFPNSAATLPRGRAYIEMAPLTFITSDPYTPDAYAWPFLFRYGLTNEVEFRLLGNGLTHMGGSAPTTGLSPLCLDMKIHLWNEKTEWLIPAMSLEVLVQTDWASNAFQGGTQPSLNLNFDLPVTDDLTLEWTIGYAGVRDAVEVVTGKRFIPRFNRYLPTVHQENLNVNQFSVQWAIEREVTEKLQLFVHGYYNGAILFQQGAGSVAGLGFFYNCNKRLTFFGSCNAGLSSEVAPLSTQLGFAFAL